MDWLSSRVFKIISFAVLFFFTWTSGGMFEIAHAISNSKESGVKSSELKKEKPEGKLQKALEEIDGILNDTAADTDTKKNKLKTKKTEIDNIDAEIRKQFKETEDKIKDLPEAIKKRHRDFVKKYEDNLKECKTKLDDIERAKTKEEKEEAHKKAKEFLDKAKPPKKHIPLDPNKLPHRTEEPERIEPRLKPEEFQTEQRAQNTERGQKPLLVASASDSLAGLFNSTNSTNSQLLTLDSQLPTPLLLAAATPPTSADLSQTIEVQFTPEITAKAEELQHNPVKIYNWVRNNIEFVPTYGSIQGANMCLQTKQCNAFDTASLLIALLRASNIPAKYVQGTVEIPIEKVKNWVGGFTDSNSALSFIASGGIPVGGITEGGQIKYVQMEHMWVEAWIDYIPSRGEIHRQGDTWIPLDASFKQYNYTQGIDIKSAVPFDAEAFINQITATANINETEGYVTNVNSSFINQTMTDYQAQVQNYTTQNFPNGTIGDMFGKQDIIKHEFSYLLGTLPYKTIVKGTVYSNIPDNLRHKIIFNVTSENDIFGSQPLAKTISIPELTGKRITLNYLPASASDASVLASYGYYSTPPYLVNLKPVLFVEGVQIAAGGYVGMGALQSLNITFKIPNRSSEIVKHPLNASAMVSIGLDIQKITSELIGQRKAKLDLALSKLGISDVGFDDLIGEVLNIHALSYFAMYEMFNEFTASGRIAYSKSTEEMAVMINPSVEYLYGVPFRITNPNLEIDVKRYVMARKSLSGDSAQEVNFLFSTGLISSALEHGVAIPALKSIILIHY